MKERSTPELRGPERVAIHVLRWLGRLLFLAAIGYLLAPLIGPWTSAFRPLPWVGVSVAKVSLLGALCLYASADLHRRRSLVTVIIAAHAFSVLAMVALLLFGSVSGDMPGTGLGVATMLYIAIGMDAVIVLALVCVRVAIRHQTAGGIYALDDHEPVTAAEGNLRAFATVFGAGAILGAGAIVWLAARGNWPELLAGAPWVTNTATFLFTLGLVFSHATREIRQRQSLVGVGAHAVGVGVWSLLLYWAVGPGTSTVISVGSRSVSNGDVVLLVAAAFAATYAATFALYQVAWRERYRLTFLGPMEFRTLLALADVLIEGEEEALSPLSVAMKVDETVFKIGAQRRWIYRLILMLVYLHPVILFRAPLPEMAFPPRRKYLRRYFHRAPLRGRMIKFVRDQISGAIRAAKQLVYVGYYSQREAWETIGYRPFSERDPQPGEGARTVSDTTLDVWGVDHEELKRDRISTDICIIGSGAAGGMLALELAGRYPGADILVVERGKYVPPAAFSEDEVDMMAALYADGLFQQTRDSRFTILQGSCVGGTTVVNNAVSFKTPGAVLDVWKTSHGTDLGADFQASLNAVWSYMGVQKQEAKSLNPSATPYFANALNQNVTRPLTEADIVNANIQDCLGCGYCNIGCAYGKKISMLDRTLPEAQSLGVKIMSDARVERLYTTSGKRPRISTALVRLAAPGAPENDRGARLIEIEAGTFILAAGAIASPWLLMKSGVGRDLPVGAGMSFNMGAPITAEFADTSSFRGGLAAYEGLQISHFGMPGGTRGWVHETWWNPPVAQAVNMPGWFGRHFDNMRNYRNLMAVGILVGTASEGRVRRALLGGADVDYEPNQTDLGRLADGLTTTAEILFEAGARRVFLNTAGLDGDVMTTRRELDAIPEICSRGSEYMTLGTGHPQGGNSLGVDPEKSVVSAEDFRVHGYENLYLCDASVFPTSITVNPQITVMALAHLASRKVNV